MTMNPSRIVAILAFAPTVHALPNPAQIESAIEGAPLVAAASADVERAEAGAERLIASPYELEIGVSGGQRNTDYVLDGDDDFTEWAGSISRTVRLPGKSRVDRELAVIRIELAHAMERKARLNETLRFVDLWVQWETAVILADTSRTLADEARQLAELEQTKVDAGGERQVFADQFLAEAELAEVQAAQDSLAADNARNAILIQFPGTELPSAPRRTELPRSTIESLLEDGEISPVEKRVATLARREAEVAAKRSDKNRTPDPTIGLSVSDEFGGLEQSVMAQLSIPIGGRARRAGAREAAAAARMRAYELEAAMRAVRQRFESERANAQRLDATLGNARKAAEIARSALRRLEQGYDIGAVTIAELVTASVIYRKAERTYQQQRAAAYHALVTVSVLSGRLGWLQ